VDSPAPKEIPKKGEFFLLVYVNLYVGLHFRYEWRFCSVKDYSDEELMRLAMNDDARAFEELFRRYKRRLFGFFYGLVLNAEQAQDCVQETFLRLWQRRTHFAQKGRFSAYLFQIAKNHFLDNSRRQKSHIDLQRVWNPEQAGCLHQASLSTGGYSEAVVNEIRAAVSDAMARLPEIHRLVYVLSEEQQMSYKEIADILECPVGTVSSRKVEAVRKLRNLLEPLRAELFGEGR
jgi:RNA polymerase sigma-70 factor (ECF subfamily)